MISFDPLIRALEIVLTGQTLYWMLAGVLLGIALGSLPGIGASLAMAILLPFTLFLEGVDAIVLLISIHSGTGYGGSISAILMNAPGTSGSAATTFDGYSMSRKGEAAKALSISASASALGGSLTIIALLLILPLLVPVVLLFGSPEYFLVAFLGILLITIVARGSMFKGIIAGAFGMLIATIGVAPIDPETRYTFDTFLLYNGIDYISVLIGIFAIAEMINLSEEKGGIATSAIETSGSIFEGLRYTINNFGKTIKSSAIGLGVGAVPGTGASIANFVAYGEAMRSDKDSDSFGQGNPHGVLAPEAANNGTVAGSLIPTLAFGIPGGGATAVLLGGLVMHGMRPGPDLFSSDLHLTYAVVLSLLVSNLVILVIGLLVVTRASYITRVDASFIIPMVVVLAFLGGLSIRNNWLDVYTIFLFGIIGYVMKYYNFSIISFILGVILGPILESNLHRTLLLADGSYSAFASSPLSLLLLLLSAIILITPLYKLMNSS